MNPRSGARWSAVAAFAVGLAATLAWAVAWTRAQPPQDAKTPYLTWICLPEMKVSPGEALVPVGCALIDCCSQCPVPRPIAWRIRVNGPDLGAVTIRFENMTPDQRGSLRLEHARWLDHDTVILTGSEATLAGFRNASGERPAVGIPRIAFDTTKVNAYVAEASHGSGSRRIALMIDQFLDRAVVAKFAVVYRITTCGKGSLEDQIDLEDNEGADDAVIYVEGRRAGGCVEHESFVGSDIVGVGNLLAPADCTNEVAIFSDDNGVTFLDASEGVSPAWSDYAGDIVTAPLEPLIEVPYTIWVVGGEGADTRAVDESVLANDLYNDNHMGLHLVPDIRYMLDDEELEAASTSDTSRFTDAWRDNLKDNFFVAGQPNIYYVRGEFTGLMDPGDYNIILIGTVESPESLAHELGHSFSLSHTDGVEGFDATNVMWPWVTGRDQFSEGQAYRANRHDASVLFKNGTTAVHSRDCDGGDPCLPIAEDTPN